MTAPLADKARYSAISGAVEVGVEPQSQDVQWVIVREWTTECVRSMFAAAIDPFLSF
jgi:hypothetical protein